MSEPVAVDLCGNFIFPENGRMQESEDELLPLPAGRYSFFIAGPPGAGKSYYISRLLRNLVQFPIFLFSSVSEDGNFDVPLHRVKMEKEVISKLTLDTFRKFGEEVVLVFDDIDKIREKALEKEVFRLIEDALANGRGHAEHDGVGDVHIIVSSHALNDYRKTKYMTENSEYIVVFPKVTLPLQLNTLFKKLGIREEDVRCITSCSGRALTIHKFSPTFIIFGNRFLQLTD